MITRSMLILTATLLLAACGGGGDAASGGADVEVDFPHIDGADRIDAATLDAEQLPFAASDAVGSLHVAEGRPMDISLIPGTVMRQYPDKAEGHDLTPFEVDTDDVGANEVLIHTELATCQEATIDDCIQAVFDTLYPPLQTP